MMKTKIAIGVGTLLMVLCSLWAWQACYRETPLSISLPRWANRFIEQPPSVECGGNRVADVRHFIVIHKSQIHRWGTLWMRARGNLEGGLEFEVCIPIYDGQDYRRQFEMPALNTPSGTFL